MGGLGSELCGCLSPPECFSVQLCLSDGCVMSGLELFRALKDTSVIVGAGKWGYVIPRSPLLMEGGGGLLSCFASLRTLYTKYGGKVLRKHA